MQLTRDLWQPPQGRIYAPLSGQLFAVWFLSDARGPGMVVVGCAIIAASALVGWLLVWRRRRASADTPTSTVAGAAQGYVELFGRAVAHEGRLLLTRHSRRECVWFRWLQEEQVGSKWKVVDKGASPDTFLLRDATGDCVIDPDGAEVVTASRRSWFNQPYRFTEWVIAPGESLYALGHFRTIDPADPVFSPEEDMKRLLAEWKRDRRGLLRRFDANGDGQIDMSEWERARQAAADEVGTRPAQAELPEMHVLGASPDGRPFVLSTSAPNEEAGRHAGLLAWYVASFAMAAVAAIFLGARWVF